MGRGFRISGDETDVSTVCHLALSLSLITAVQPARAQESPPLGWLERSIRKEAARLAVATAAQETTSDVRVDQPSKWSRVVALERGVTILVELRGVPPVSRRFVWADDSELIVVNLDHPQLPDEARRALREAVSTHPDTLRRLNDGAQFVYRNVRVTPDGIFVAGRKVVETSDVLERIRRGDVAAIMAPPSRRGSVAGAVVGGIAGLAVGFPVARNFMYSTNRHAGVWIGLSLVGCPVGGAWLGSQARPGVTERIIYRAP